MGVRIDVEPDGDARILARTDVMSGTDPAPANNAVSWGAATPP